jgi:hypothetical protein
MFVPFLEKQLTELEVIEKTHKITMALSKIGKGQATVYDLEDEFTQENVACYLTTYAPAMTETMDMLQVRYMVKELDALLGADDETARR